MNKYSLIFLFSILSLSYFVLFHAQKPALAQCVDGSLKQTNTVQNGAATCYQNIHYNSNCTTYAGGLYGCTCPSGQLVQTNTLPNGCKQNVHYNSDCSTYLGGVYGCPPTCTEGAIKETITLANGCKQNIHYNSNCTTYAGGQYACPPSCTSGAIQQTIVVQNGPATCYQNIHYNSDCSTYAGGLYGCSCVDGQLVQTNTLSNGCKQNVHYNSSCSTYLGGVYGCPTCTEGAIKETITLANGCKQNIHYNTDCTTYTGGQYACPTCTEGAIKETITLPSGCKKNIHYNTNCTTYEGGLYGCPTTPCPDACFSDDLRTNVSRNPSTGACDSGYFSTSHFCTASNLGNIETCGGNTWSCTSGSGGTYYWAQGINAASGITNNWVCNSAGTAYVCQGNSQAQCCGEGCNTGTPTEPTAPPAPLPPACTVAGSPNPLVIVQGQNQTITANVNIIRGAVSSVQFQSLNDAIVSVSPTSDESWPYQTTAIANGVGSTGVAVYVTMAGAGQVCQNQITVNVTAPAAWWQTKDADILASGDLRSSIPSSCTGACTPQLSLPGSGGYSGVPTYSGTASLGSGTVSSSGWQAKTSYSGRPYDYEWYKSLIVGGAEEIDCSSGCNLNNADINAKAADDKVNMVIYKGNVTITNNVNLNNKKVAMFVEGNLNINDRITFNDGTGFFAIFVQGNIAVNPSVTHPTQPSLEGLYISSGSFSTGSGNSRFYLRGSVIAWNGVTLQRDLGASNTNTPAEYFEYAPDLILNFPPQLFRDGIVWREVAP